MNKHTALSLIGIVLIAASAFGDGFIIVPPPPRPRPVPDLPSPYPLEVKYHHVETAIDEMTAVTYEKESPIS